MPNPKRIAVKVRKTDGTLLDVQTPWRERFPEPSVPELVEVIEVDAPQGVELWEILAHYKLQDGQLVLKK